QGQLACAILQKSQPAIGAGTRVRTRDQSYRYSPSEFGAKRRGMKMVLGVVQPAQTFGGQFEIPVPDVRRFGRGLSAEKVKGGGLRGGLNTHPSFDRLDVHPPSTRVRQTMISTVVHEHLAQ